MRLFFISLLFSFSAFAANWSELFPGKSYSLFQSFQLKQLERSGSLLDFTKGDLFALKEIIPLSMPGALLNLYIFDYPKCPGTDMETDMEIIAVKGSSPLVEVGAFVEECELRIYLETKDFNRKSLFE